MSTSTLRRFGVTFTDWTAYRLDGVEATSAEEAIKAGPGHVHR